MRYYVSIFLIVLPFFCFELSCSGKKATPSLVSGLYLMDLQDGKIQTWLIAEDFTFEQKVYNSNQDFKIERPLVFHRGKWQFKTNTARPVILFNSSYTIYNGLDQQLSKPVLVTGETAGWEEPQGDNASCLDFFADKGRVAWKLKSNYNN